MWDTILGIQDKSDICKKKSLVSFRVLSGAENTPVTLTEGMSYAECTDELTSYWRTEKAQ